MFFVLYNCYNNYIQEVNKKHFKMNKGGHRDAAAKKELIIIIITSGVGKSNNHYEDIYIIS